MFDPEAALNEAVSMINALQQRLLSLAGENGALKKKLAAAEEQLKAQIDDGK